MVSMLTIFKFSDPHVVFHYLNISWLYLHSICFWYLYSFPFILTPHRSIMPWILLLYLRGLIRINLPKNSMVWYYAHLCAQLLSFSFFTRGGCWVYNVWPTPWVTRSLMMISTTNTGHYANLGFLRCHWSYATIGVTFNTIQGFPLPPKATVIQLVLQHWYCVLSLLIF